jgi:hypothetical protein
MPVVARALIICVVDQRKGLMTLQRLLGGIAMAAALTIVGPVWAQNSPSGGNGMGMPGQNSPPDNGGGLSTEVSPATSVTPTAHHGARHAGAMHAHYKHVARKAALTGVTAEKLNRKELARVQTKTQAIGPKQIGQLREDQAKKQEQLRNMYDMFRASTYKQ